MVSKRRQTILPQWRDGSICGAFCMFSKYFQVNQFLIQKRSKTTTNFKFADYKTCFNQENHIPLRFPLGDPFSELETLFDELELRLLLAFLDFLA